MCPRSLWHANLTQKLECFQAMVTISCPNSCENPSKIFLASQLLNKFSSAEIAMYTLDHFASFSSRFSSSASSYPSSSALESPRSILFKKSAFTGLISSSSTSSEVFARISAFLIAIRACLLTIAAVKSTAR